MNGRALVDYRLVHGSKEGLAEAVRALIRDGWKPLGAPLIESAPSPRPGLLQAMVKYQREGR